MSPFDRLKRLLDLFHTPEAANDVKARKPARQVAAIALRSIDGACEILMVTSRDTGRWIVPKGWIEPGEDGGTAAAREAWEEAGLRGDIDPGGPVGSFRYIKQRPRRGDLLCEVDVYLLHNVSITSEWPEKTERTRRWLPVAQALDLIAEDGLRPVICQAVIIHKAA